MGIVYEGRDPNLDRRVAIKTVKVENLSPEAAAEYDSRFRTEARSAARLQHPNIVSVYDSDRDGDVAFLVMEYIDGEDLKHHLDGGERYPLAQALRIVDDLLSALDYAHRQGIVHRDIKPANLLIEASGRVKLTDFGVARIQDAGDATRTQGAMVGTLKYMAPEQVQGQKVDARADLFSAGVLLYQLLTDQRPFDGDNEYAIIQQIVGQAPRPPSSVNARLPAAIDAVVARALAKSCDQRYPTAAEFADALRAAMRQAEDPTVVPPPNPARGGPGGIYLVTSPGGTMPMGSTVTQELELVYWKDVKDSNDREDLELFLEKFPAGIYAELARRRLRRLGVEPAADQTVLTGMAAAEPPATFPGRRAARTPPAPRAGVGDGSATIPLALAALRSAAAAQARQPDIAATLPGVRPVPGTAGRIDMVDPAAAPGPQVDISTIPLPPPHVQEATVAPQPAAAPAAAQPGRLPAVAVLAGVALLAVGGVAALAMMFRGGGEVPSVAATGTASAPVAVASAVTPGPAAASGPVAADAARRGAAAASRPATAAARPRPVAKQVATAPAVEPARAAAAPPSAAPAPAPPPEAREQVRAAAPPARAPASNPADACRDRMFIARELCLAEQCDKPAARNHPLCVQRREDAKLREESRVRN